MNQKSISWLQGLPSNLVGSNRGTSESFGSQGYKVNTMVFWAAWCMACGSCSFRCVHKNQAFLLTNQDHPFPFGKVTSIKPIRAYRDAVIRCFMALCAPVILTNFAVGVLEQNYSGTSWRSNNPFVQRVPEEVRQCLLGIFKRQNSY